MEKMNKLFKGALFLALVGTVIVGCEKEDSISPTASSAQENFKSKSKSNKSSYTDFELMGMAANVESITYSPSTDDYEVEFYGTIETHIVKITTWQDDLIKMTITEGSNNYSIEINEENEEVSITTLGTYTFSEFDEIEVNLSNNVLENLTSIIPAHHTESAESNVTFDDNGDDDNFPTSTGSDRIRFWWTKSTLVSPCFGGTEIYNVQYERLWLFKGSKTVKLPC